jgi:hypothetical protein
MRSLWQRIKAKFETLPVIGVSKRNFLMISADIRKGTVIVSYKGKVKTGLFTDKTLRQMMNGVHFDKNVGEFLNATGKLISKVTE